MIMASIQCVFGKILLQLVFVFAIRAAITLPPLLGHYEVGTRRVEAIDHDRLDLLAPTPCLNASALVPNLALVLWDSSTMASCQCSSIGRSSS